jgi:hypothetical protein
MSPDQSRHTEVCHEISSMTMQGVWIIFR